MKKLTIKEALYLLLDQVDYMADNCRINEMVGAVLPIQVIELCREALNANTEESNWKPMDIEKDINRLEE